MRIQWFLQKLLYPCRWGLLIIPIISFGLLLFVFYSQLTETGIAYLSYCLSAYSLVILVVKFVRIIKEKEYKNNFVIRKVLRIPFVDSYLHDKKYHRIFHIYGSVLINFVYVIFRMIAGILYASVWFFTMAVYYLVLGCIRMYLVKNYQKQQLENEWHCYTITAWLLFLLHLPMGVMIFLMVRTNAGITYPGYLIYCSALYTFYSLIVAMRDLLKDRKTSQPVLRGIRVVNFISAMMSILALQTAMISRFSNHGEEYRMMMNAITGGFVYCGVIILALAMLFISKKEGRINE